MYCKKSQHVFGIDYDIEFACDSCDMIFVEADRVWLERSHASMKDLRECLRLQFGHYWKIEWYKLIATRDIVRKIRLANPSKDSMCIKLHPGKVYTLADFIELSELINNQDE